MPDHSYRLVLDELYRQMQKRDAAKDSHVRREHDMAVHSLMRLRRAIEQRVPNDLRTPPSGANDA